MRLNKRPVQQWVGPCSPFKVRQLRFAAPMGCRALLTASALLASLGLTASPVLAQSPEASSRVLAQRESGFNPDAVRAMIARGDAAASRGDLATARSEYDKARKASKQLLGFYRDLSGAFRGLDARIPREMDSKGVKLSDCWPNPTCDWLPCSVVRTNRKWPCLFWWKSSN